MRSQRSDAPAEDGGLSAEGSDAHELVLAIPPDPGLISVARLFAAAVCRHIGCDEDRIDDVRVAVSEAVTNAVKAHLDSSTPVPLRILARAEASRVRFEVVDAGPGFDAVPSPLPGMKAATPPQGLFEGSLGLTVIRALFPDTVIVRNGDRGMSVSFTVQAEGA